MMSPARVAADVAAIPLNDPLGRLARRRLALAISEQELTMTGTDPRDVQTPIEAETVQIGPPPRRRRQPAAGGLPRHPTAGLLGPSGNPHGPNVVAIVVDTPAWRQRVPEKRNGAA